MTAEVTFIHGDELELEWGFRDGNPKVKCGGYANVEVDPCPAYPHNKNVAYEALCEVMEKWPAPVPLTVYLLNHEETARTNGHSQHQRNFYDEDNRLDDHRIVLSAKRVPPHPCMTRYLMAHEYGHHVQWWVQQEMGMEYSDDPGFERDVYAPLRGMEHVSARPGQWHVATGEVFACDFRLIMTGIEAEFWPHDPIERPDGAELLDWWMLKSELDYSQVARYVPHDEVAEALAGTLFEVPA